MRAQAKKQKKRNQEPLISITPHHNFYLDRPNTTRKSCLERWLTSIGDDWVGDDDGQLPVIVEITAHLRLSTTAAVDLFQNLQEFCTQSLWRREYCSFTTRDWQNLPPEITTQILAKIGPVNLTLNARRVCSSWFNISQDPCLWRSVEFTRLRVRRRVSTAEMERIYALAIHTSRGYLESLYIEGFCTDDLLFYIAESSPNLRRLRLSWCQKLTTKGLNRAAKRLPLLEEIEITGCEVSTYALGKLCPRLTSFKFNYLPCLCLCCGPLWWYPPPDGCIIAETMSGIRHLQLLGFGTMTRKGLLAILDACTQLESLDLRDYELNFRGELYEVDDNVPEDSDDLEMRCFTQVKEFRSWKEKRNDLKKPDCLMEVNLEALNDEYWFSEKPIDDHEFHDELLEYDILWLEYIT